MVASGCRHRPRNWVRGAAGLWFAPAVPSPAVAEAEGFLRRFAAAGPQARARLAAEELPLAALHEAALTHPDPFARRALVGVLDHYANDESTAVFAAALRDPVELVRHTALHSIACETCRDGDLCPADVVPALAEVLASDPSPEVRHKAIPVLLRLGAPEAVERAAREDDDELVREVAARALRCENVRARKAYLRRRRRRSRAVPR